MTATEIPQKPTQCATAPAQNIRYPLAHVTYGAEEIAAVVETLEAGQTTCGPRVAAFEKAFAEYVGAEHAVMVNSGSSADLLCALELGPTHSGEVLLPAVTWPTQVSACLIAGYRVRLVDVSPETLQMDLNDLERKVDSRSVAVFAMHALGIVGDIEKVQDIAQAHHLALFEDACEALGSRYRGKHVGTFGQAAAFSFFFSHVLSTMEGGMVVTDDGEAAHRLRLRRNHGWEPKDGEHFHFPTWGMNLRPTELQGAFGLVQLGKLPGFIAARRRNFMRLHDAIWRMPFDQFVQPIRKPVLSSPSWHAFPLMLSPKAPFSKRELCAYLNEKGIETRPMIAGNIARQPAFRCDPRVIDSHLPGADAIHERGFYIGLASHDDEEGTGYVGEVINDFGRRK